jgi:hypothetical protein
VLGMVDGLDDVLIVPREIEETTTLPRGPKLRENVFTRQ